MPVEEVVESLQLGNIGDSEPPGGGAGETDSSGHQSTGEGNSGGRSSDVGELQSPKEMTSKRMGEAPPKQFILSEGLPPVPAKLVGRILKGEFVDMAELLRDNLEALRRGGLHDSATSGEPSSSTSRPRREVPDLLSWVQCFGIYMAVVASRYPERVKKLLAYQTLIVWEARRCGGKGWLSYDSYFRQQMAGDWKGDEWGRLNPYLFSSTFLALGSPCRPSCTLCLEPDHQEDVCSGKS